MQHDFAKLSSQIKGVTLSESLKKSDYISKDDDSGNFSLRTQGPTFIDEVPDDLYCPLCLDVLTDPCQTSCGHHYCSRCVTPLMANRDPCPVCREREFSIMRNLALQRQIDNMQVSCCFQEQGCSWTGLKKNLDDHLEMACNFSSVPCLFRKFGCFDSVLRTELDEHLRLHFAEHMLMISEARKTQQTEMEAFIEERDRKIMDLEKRLKLLETKNNEKLQTKSDILWHPLPLTHIGGFDAGVPCGCTLQLQLPMNLIPADAKEVLLHTSVAAGSSLPHGGSFWLGIYIKEGQTTYRKTSRLTTCKQDAWSNNTENMWFPMPTDRCVYLEVQRRSGPLERNVRCNISVIGYR